MYVQNAPQFVHTSGDWRGALPPRPPKAKGKRHMADNKKYDARLEIRCSKAELAEWRAVAAASHCSLAAYVRSCLSPPPPFAHVQQIDPALVRHLSAIGNNLNQLTRWANTYKSQAEADIIIHGIDACSQELRSFVDKHNGDGHVD